MTPTQAKGHERHRSFHAAIARKAAELASAAVSPSVEHPAPLPPIPNPTVAAAAEVAFPSWVHEVTKIQQAVCKDFGITRHDMRSQRRTKNLVIPRQIAMLLCKKLTERSLPDIARRFGGRDHTTALHSIRKAEQLLSTDPDMRARVSAIAESLGGSIE